MAVEQSAVCASLHAQYQQVLAALEAGPVSSFSDQGRSVTYDRAALRAELVKIAQDAARAGCPILDQKFVFSLSSRVRP